MRLKAAVLAVSLVLVPAAGFGSQRGVTKSYVESISRRTGYSERYVREAAVEALRKSGRFTRGELEAIGRGREIFLNRGLEVRRYLNRSTSFRAAVGLAALRNAKIESSAASAFEALARKPARVRDVSKNHPIREAVDKTALKWSEWGVMNDNGILLRARQLVAEDETAGFGELMAANEGLMKEMFKSRENKEFPDVEIRNLAFKLTRKEMLASLKRLAVYGFDLNPRRINVILRESMGSETGDPSILESFTDLTGMYSFSHRNSVLLKSEAVVGSKEEGRRRVLHYSFVNLGTGKMLTVFVRGKTD